jgi:hypothetical protein
MAELARAVALEPNSAMDVARGVGRLRLAEGLSPIVEFSLPNNRQLDVAARGLGGTIARIEIKVSFADLRADDKWPDGLSFCDLFFFAVPPEFPPTALPSTTGLIVADRFGVAIIRQSQRKMLHASRRRALTLRFAMIAAERLTRAYAPNCS